MIVSYWFPWRRPEVRVAAVLILVLFALAGGAEPLPAAVPDDTFAERHPRLLFSSAERAAMRARVLDGGAAAEAYAFIRSRCYDVYPLAPLDSLVQDDAALEPMINLALVSHFEAQVDTQLVNLGRRLTLYIARTSAVNTDPYGSSLRLRALSLGFDHFFVHATAAEREEVRVEAAGYIAYMLTNINYDAWLHRPYVSNKTAMIAAALGLSAICFRDELDAVTTGAALAKADEYFQVWRDTHLAGDGCYREGSLYIGWSMRHLVYYFAARKRFDGFDYAQDPLIQAIERWVPYELDPRGEGRLNNIQDQTDYYRPLARHTTYWAWAQSQWRSGLAAYMWDHSAGALGRDMLDENDKASTVLWHSGITPINPGAVLGRSRVWEDRGLYYFRTGWPDGATSGDVVFSFYSGEFRGGHAQEDQNQFTLAAYGEKLVLDQGAGSQAKQTEAHNLVRIDGAGQHNAGSSIGTDGRMAEYVLSDFADYVRGDATLAYTTHSPYNNAGVPYSWSNWSWGLSGANPVENATRGVLAVHGGDIPPYFIIRDDVRKDGGTHQYDWCMHVPAASTVDTSADPMLVSSGNAELHVYPVYPDRSALTAGVTAFDNGNSDPNSLQLVLGTQAVDPHFTLVLLPLPAGAVAPSASRESVAGGASLKLEWSSGIVDDIVMQVPLSPGGAAMADPFPWVIQTDAPLALVRKDGPTVTAYSMVDGTWLSVGTMLVAAVEDGPATLLFDGMFVHVSRPDAAFRVIADAVSAVLYRGTQLPAHREGEYLVGGYTTGAGDGPAADLALRAYPNPFNPSVRISFVTPQSGEVEATIHDAAGRRVRNLLSRFLEAGAHVTGWDGRDDRGIGAASGVYFLRVRAGGRSDVRKLVLLR
jgi:hypothetical protein